MFYLVHVNYSWTFQTLSRQYNYDKTIVDSGTTNLRVSEEVFDAILDRLKKFDKVSLNLLNMSLLAGSIAR